MPQAAPRLALSGLAFVILFMPWIAPVAFDAFAEPLSQKGTLAHQANMSMRLENWDFLSRRIMDNPWTGFGLDTTRAMVFDTDQKYFHGNTIIHPHNIALQIWIEFGLIGAVSALAFLVFLYTRLTSVTLTDRIMPFALLGGVSAFLLVAWSSWASWLDALILLIAGLLILVIKPKAGRATS
jgi:O-antigen ligase